MLSAMFALAMFAEGPLLPHLVGVCNDMKISIDGVTFEAGEGGVNQALNTTLKPGECVSDLGLAPGDYTLHFIEHGANDQVAMCVRKIKLKAFDTIHISADDGAQCIQ